MKRLALLAALAAATPLTPAMAQDKLNVVASFSILGDIVANVCGDACDVSTIVGPDADAHTYEPTMADAITVAEADVIFVNAMGFETWSATLIENSGTNASVVNVNANANVLMVEGEVDPHAWNDPSNVEQMALIIADAVGVGSEGAAAYVDQIEAVMAEYQPRFDALPVNGRTVVTAHDAFGYLGRAMGFTFLAPVGIDGEAEPNARALAELIDQIKETGAAALFVENINNPDLIAQIADETGLSVGGQLFSDALSEKGGPATSYLAMLDYNLNAILTELEK